MKKWYLSKTLWVNTLMFAGVVVMTFTGTDLFNAEAQAGILVGVNMVLRMITNESLTA